LSLCYPWVNKMKALPFALSWPKFLTRLRKIKRVKTPTVLQMEAVECGAAALGIILAYHGRFVSPEELRVACGVSRDGSKANNILKAARSYGLEAKGFRCEPENLKTFAFPSIVHWNFNHFLVVEGSSPQHMYLNDPASGPRVVSHEEFDHSFTGVVLTFAPGDAFTAGGTKPSLLRSLKPRLSGAWGTLFYILLVSLSLIVPGLLIPVFSRVFVDSILVQGREQWVVPLLLGMGLTAVLRALFLWLQQEKLLRLETKLDVAGSSKLFWHTLQLPIEFFNQRSAGDINSRIGMNVRVAQLLSSELSTTFLNLLLIGFYAVLMVQYSFWLTLVTVSLASLNLFVLKLVARRRVDINNRLIKERSQMLSAAFSGLQSIETIKANGQESDFFARWAGRQAKAITSMQDLGKATQFISVLPGFLSALSSAAILGLGGWLILNNELTAGMLVAFQSLAASFLAPVNQLVNMGGQLQEVEGTMRRLEDILSYRTDPTIRFGETAPSLERWPLGKLSGQLELKNVTFGYSRLAPPLIENLSLTVEPGRRIALIGASGSGKSTVARLLNGLYQPWSGEILLDGTPRHLVPRILLNSSLAAVNQEIFLFEDTIRNNLTAWDDSVLEADLIAAAKDAHIHDLIAALPKGYNTVVSEGGKNFSGGQRQRMEIARALVTNPSILILDEATSALDPITEQIINDNLLKRGCTCLIVAHRLSTIRDCDEIIVMENGRIVERGTHNTLWRQRGVYANLIRSGTQESEYLLENIMESLAL